jgi:peroxiredoxin
VIKEDDFVQKVWRVKRVVEGKVTMSSDTIRDLRKQADTLIELGRKKHYRSQS